MNKKTNSIAKKNNTKVYPTLLRLVKYGRRHWFKIAGAIVSVLIATGLGLAPPWLIRYGIDNLIRDGKSERLWLLGIIMVSSALLKGVFDFLKSYLSEYIAQNVIHDIRVKLFKHLHNLSFSFYDESQTGELMSRLTTDADTLRSFLGRVGPYVFSNLLTIIGILVIMFVWDYRLGFLYILLLPLMVYGMKVYATKVKPMFRKARKKFAELTHLVQENLVGIEVIKLFGSEKEEEKKFNNKNDEYIEVNLKAAKTSAFWMPYVNFLIGLGTSLVVWYGGRLVIRDIITLGTLAGFISYISMLIRPIRQTGMMINATSKAAAAGERIFEIMDTKPEVKESENAYRLEDVKGNIEFKNVSFSYDKSQEVLKDISLAIKAGQTIAVVGPTGAGKSTLLHLLLRFYDPDQGEIFLDGNNLKDIKLSSLRKQIGIVLQHTFLFGASIKENISYGKPEVETKEIVKAAQVAQIHEFIKSLPLGYETPVGERGVTLSGGQKQRLAIARVLLTNPALLILDEPTSSIDVETEKKMQAAMKQVIKDRTTFIIAHRLWTVKNADQIVVIKDGQIKEKGTHQELLAKADGFYKKIYKNVLQDNDSPQQDRTKKVGETE